MSVENKKTSRTTNGVGNSHNGQGRTSNHDTGSGGAHQFHQLSAADEPYFAHNRMHDRSAHVSRLSDQIDKTDEILRG